MSDPSQAYAEATLKIDQLIEVIRLETDPEIQSLLGHELRALQWYQGFVAERMELTQKRSFEDASFITTQGPGHYYRW